MVNDGLHSPETNDTADTNEEGEEPVMFDRKTSLAKDPQSLRDLTCCPKIHSKDTIFGVFFLLKMLYSVERKVKKRFSVKKEKHFSFISEEKRIFFGLLQDKLICFSFSLSFSLKECVFSDLLFWKLPWQILFWGNKIVF